MRMYPLLAVLLVFFASCKTNSDVTANSDQENSNIDTVVVMLEQPQAPKDSLIISFEKTACFGRCPVYRIKVYDSGFATYEGINFAEKMGLYSTKLSREKINKIFESAEKIDFFDLQPKYENPYISDLPSTITMINTGAKKHQVFARTNIPEKLVVFQENLAVTLNENNWVPYSDR